jgi:hypothetical protein
MTAVTWLPEDVELLRRIMAGKHAQQYVQLFETGTVRPHQAPPEGLVALAFETALYTTDEAQIRKVLEASACAPLLAKARNAGAGIITHALAAAAANPLPSLSVAALVESEPLDVTVADLATNPALLQGPEAVSPWLVWRGQLTLLVGREKLAGKSTLAASDAARAAKAGHTVLWLDAEQGHNRVVSRFVDLGAPLDKLVTLRRWPQSWTEVEDVITRLGPDAIYVDSVSSFLMAVEGKVPDTSEGEKWQALVGRFKRWALLGPGSGVCGLLHATKSDGNYRGSTGIGAAPDVILTMRDDPDDKARRWLDCIGRWGFPSRCVRFEGEAKGYTSVEGAVAPKDGARISAERHKILAALGPGMTWKDWRTAYGGKESTFSAALTWLLQHELVTVGAAGTYTRNEFEASQAEHGAT